MKLWLPPSEFQGTGALRPHPDGCPVFCCQPQEPCQPAGSFLGRLSCSAGCLARNRRAQPAADFAIRAAASWSISMSICLGALLPGADVGPRRREKAEIHIARPETALCEIKNQTDWLAGWLAGWLVNWLGQDPSCHSTSQHSKTQRQMGKSKPCQRSATVVQHVKAVRPTQPGRAAQH